MGFKKILGNAKDKIDRFENSGIFVVEYNLCELKNAKFPESSLLKFVEVTNKQKKRNR